MSLTHRSRRLLELAGIAFDRKSLADFEVSAVVSNSNEAVPGAVFVALKGLKTDGNQFVGEAVRRGARIVVSDAERAPTDLGGASWVRVGNARTAYAVLMHHFFGAPSDYFKMAGVTGTNGKTTTAYLIRALTGIPQKTGVVGTIQYEFGDDKEDSSRTTPDPARLHALFARWLKNGCAVVAIEASSHALDQDRLAGIRFDTAVFTNLTQDHLDYHGTMEKYLAAKAKLFGMLRDGGTAVLNADDPAFAALSGIARNVMTYGLGPSADLRAENLKNTMGGSSFELVWNGRKQNIRTKLFGVHNVYNILGAAGAALSIGAEWAALPGRIEAFDGVPGRLEAVDAGQEFKLFVDYAHTDDGLKNVLEAIRPYAEREVIVVFGCGGDRDRGKRPKMARVAECLADFVVLTSDNPRHEDPKAILTEVASGFTPGWRNFETQPDRRKAIRRALLKARKGDVVLLAGKGHEDYQIIGDEKIPFSDRLEALNVLRGK